MSAPSGKWRTQGSTAEAAVQRLAARRSRSARGTGPVSGLAASGGPLSRALQAQWFAARRSAYRCGGSAGFARAHRLPCFTCRAGTPFRMECAILAGFSRVSNRGGRRAGHARHGGRVAKGAGGLPECAHFRHGRNGWFSHNCLSFAHILLVDWRSSNSLSCVAQQRRGFMGQIFLELAFAQGPRLHIFWHKAAQRLGKGLASDKVR